MLLYSRPLVCLFVLLALSSLPCQGLLRRDQDTLPIGKHWKNPNDIEEAPLCTNTTGASDGCFQYRDWEACTSVQCTRVSSESCMQRENLTDTACLCRKYSADSCKPCIHGGVTRLAWNEWLNATCSNVSDWSGLPVDWDSRDGFIDLRPVGTVEYNYQTNRPESVTFEYSLPMCANDTCSSFYGCLVTGLYAEWTSMVSSSGPNSWSQNTMYVERPCMCSYSPNDFPSSCTGCTSPIDRTRLLTWYNATCYHTAGFNNTASEWAKDLLIIDKDYPDQNEFKWPDCVGGSACTPSLNDTETNCTTGMRCKLDMEGNCTETTLAVDRGCFCKDLSYGKSCNGTCGLVWERQEYLNWMNTTCSPVAGWDGLPSNWTQLMAVQYSDLLPWHWEVQSPDYFASATNSTTLPDAANATTNGDPRPQCPSTAAKIGVYAAVNGAIAVLVPILGRRTVIYRLTGGLLGRPWSRSWLITGPLSIGLQIGSNALNAYMVSQVPGFSQVPIGDLTLLWCTRPRLAWLVIALLPVQSAEAMYFSVAASCLAAELVLQLVGSVYMGFATDFARKQGFYTAGALDSTPYKTNAHIMYAGSLLWLVVVGFALLAAAWSVLRVNDHISSLGRRLRGSIRLSRKHQQDIRAALKTSFAAEKECNSNWTIVAGHFDQLNDEAAATEISAAREQLEAVQRNQIRRLNKLAEEWQFLYRHLTADNRELEKARKRAKKLKVELSPGEEDVDRAEFTTAADVPKGMAAKRSAANGGDKDSASHMHSMRAARAELARLEGLHREIPETRYETAELSATEFQEELDTLRLNVRVPLDSLRRLAEARPGLGTASFNSLPQRAAVDLLQQFSSNGNILTRHGAATTQEFISLKTQWRKVRSEREGEESPADTRLRKLKEISRTAIAGMFGCWVAQACALFLVFERPHGSS